MPVTKIKSRWDSGNLIFHEYSSLASTHDILKLETGTVTIGNASNDVDFKVFLGSSSNYALFDCGGKYLFVTITQTSATPGTHRAIYGKETTHSSMTSDNLVGVRGEITMAGACSSGAYLYGAQGKAITGANAFSGKVLAGLYGQIDVTGGTISSGHVAAIQANIYGANSGSIPMEGIYVEHAGGAVINSFVQCFGKTDYVFDLASNTHVQMGTSGAATTAAGWLKIKVEGSARYINLWSTAP